MADIGSGGIELERGGAVDEDAGRRQSVDTTSGVGEDAARAAHDAKFDEAGLAAKINAGLIDGFMTERLAQFDPKLVIRHLTVHGAMNLATSTHVTSDIRLQAVAQLENVKGQVSELSEGQQQLMTKILNLKDTEDLANTLEKIAPLSDQAKSIRAQQRYGLQRITGIDASTQKPTCAMDGSGSGYGTTTGGGYKSGSGGGYLSPSDSADGYTNGFMLPAINTGELGKADIHVQVQVLQDLSNLSANLNESFSVREKRKKELQNIYRVIGGKTKLDKMKQDHPKEYREISENLNRAFGTHGVAADQLLDDAGSRELAKGHINAGSRQEIMALATKYGDFQHPDGKTKDEELRASGKRAPPSTTASGCMSGDGVPNYERAAGVQKDIKVWENWIRIKSKFGGMSPGDQDKITNSGGQDAEDLATYLALHKWLAQGPDNGDVLSKSRLENLDRNFTEKYLVKVVDKNLHPDASSKGKKIAKSMGSLFIFPLAAAYHATVGEGFQGFKDQFRFWKSDGAVAKHFAEHGFNDVAALVHGPDPKTATNVPGVSSDALNQLKLQDALQQAKNVPGFILPPNITTDDHVATGGEKDILGKKLDQEISQLQSRISVINSTGVQSLNGHLAANKEKLETELGMRQAEKNRLNANTANEVHVRNEVLQQHMNRALIYADPTSTEQQKTAVNNEISELTATADQVKISTTVNATTESDGAEATSKHPQMPAGMDGITLGSPAVLTVLGNRVERALRDPKFIQDGVAVEKLRKQITDNQNKTKFGSPENRYTSGLIQLLDLHRDIRVRQDTAGNWKQADKDSHLEEAAKDLVLHLNTMLATHRVHMLGGQKASEEEVKNQEGLLALAKERFDKISRGEEDPGQASSRIKDHIAARVQLEGIQTRSKMFVQNAAKRVIDNPDDFKKQLAEIKEPGLQTAMKEFQIAYKKADELRKLNSSTRADGLEQEANKYLLAAKMAAHPKASEEDKARQIEVREGAKFSLELLIGQANKELGKATKPKGGPSVTITGGGGPA